MGGSLSCCGEGCCPSEPQSTHRFRAHMCRDPDLPPEGQLNKGFFYNQDWQWPSVTSWDLIRAVHSTCSAIQEYMARDPLLKRLRRKSRDEDAAQVQAEEQAKEKALCAQHPRLPEILQRLPRLTVTLYFLAMVTNQIIPEVAVAHHKRTGGLGPPRKGRFKFLAAELPGENSTEEVVAVYTRDSAFQSSGSVETSVEKFIYESDEEAPQQWQARPPAVVTVKAGGLPEEKGPVETPVEKFIYESDEEAPQQWQARPPAVVTVKAGGLPEEKGPVETPVEKFIYESDEEAPQQWQARPPAVVTVKAGGLPEEKGPVETPVEKFIYESDEEAPQQWQARPPAVVTVKAGGLPEEKGPVETPVEKFIYESDEEAPQQWQARPPAVVTVKAGGLPEEKGPVETPVEKFIYESDEEAPQQWQARPPAVVTVKAGGLPEEKGPVETPVEKFIYESDEEAPQQWQASHLLLSQ
ncbi:titin-like [Trachypithecus francoisi]|uniref:titin-like n=1 Tax=Trachypithecus francoisi TaxID=54180 RepID=UPI00141AF60D|nr:titin-like [Trachypithecus francoisi]